MIRSALMIAALTFGTATVTARADEVVDRVLDSVILPTVADFATATSTLAQAADAGCRAENPALRAAWNHAMDAWLAMQDFRFGPLEDNGTRQAIAYWPDAKGHRPRALARILSGADPVLQTPDRYAEVSVAARGLYAVEAMLFDPAFSAYGPTDPGCVLVRAAASDLATVAAQVSDGWTDDFATVMRTAGAEGNTRFLDVSEARQAIFTALMASMQFDIDERLGLPLGSFDRPRPLRAEGRLSGRSQRNLELSLAGHLALVEALSPDAAAVEDTQKKFARAMRLASELDDPDFSGVDDPTGRFRLEALQAELTLLRSTANAELGAALGVSMGLNALDGD